MHKVIQGHCVIVSSTASDISCSLLQSSAIMAAFGGLCHPTSLAIISYLAPCFYPVHGLYPLWILEYCLGQVSMITLASCVHCGGKLSACRHLPNRSC